MSDSGGVGKSCARTFLNHNKASIRRRFESGARRLTPNVRKKYDQCISHLMFRYKTDNVKL